MHNLANPLCQIEPNESRCSVPDERYDYLCEVWKSPSKIPAYLQITDIAGLIKGASEGAGLGNAFLSHIQAVDGIFHIVRIFENPDVIHVDDCVDPIVCVMGMLKITRAMYKARH